METMSPYQATQILDSLCQQDAELETSQHLAKAALLFAIENGQDIDLDEQLILINKLALEAAVYVDISGDVSDIAKGLCYFFKEIKGYQGDTDDYYRPENSFLNQVVAHRKGIPISLAVLYISVANRLGFDDIAGVAFPGHFLLCFGGKANTGEAVYVDPFDHRIINDAECEKKLQSLFGKQARMHRSFLFAVDNRNIIARMARNLVEVFQNTHQYEAALVCCSRAISSAPGQAEDHFIRAALYEKLECHSAAIQEFARFIYLSPKDERIGDIKREIARLREGSSKSKYVH